MKFTRTAWNLLIALLVLAIVQALFAGSHIREFGRWSVVFVYALAFFALLRMPRLRKAARASLLAFAALFMMSVVIAMLPGGMGAILYAWGMNDVWFPFGSLLILTALVYPTLLIADLVKPRSDNKQADNP